MANTFTEPGCDIIKEMAEFMCDAVNEDVARMVSQGMDEAEARKAVIGQINEFGFYLGTAPMQ